MIEKKSRREFIKQTTLAGFGGIALTSLPGILPAGNIFLQDQSFFSCDPLPYAYDALEPYIDKVTMELHYGKHHQGYVNNLNKALVGINVDKLTLGRLCANVSKYNMTIRNNAGGHYNHSLFWSLMKPNGGGVPSGKIAEAINDSFGSFENFKTKFNDAATKVFGSGWAWLVVDANKKLQIGSTANQDNPLMDVSEFKGTPVLALDVWEHAYYLKNQNRRVDYITAWWNVVNWEKANELFLLGMK